MGRKRKMGGSEGLTGVWHGLYTYTTQPFIPESHFVCVLIDSGGRLTGTAYETMNHYRRAATNENATIEGSHNAGTVSFIKTYDGSGKQSHSVSYSGHANATQDEIEGTWKIGGIFRSVTGRFLMVRKRSESHVYSEELQAHHAREETKVS
jgi:hypothetical protein